MVPKYEINYHDLAQTFLRFSLKNEDDVKTYFRSNIFDPIAKAVSLQGEYHGEVHFKNGGRADATFQAVIFEYKKARYFESEKGQKEALYGRDENDMGIFDYILSSSSETYADEKSLIANITSKIGIGFDGNSFIFARFVPSLQRERIEDTKVASFPNGEYPIKFFYFTLPLEKGIRYLTLVLSQRNKKMLTKDNILEDINPNNEFVRESILSIYNELEFELHDIRGSNRVRTLFAEWDKTFGKLYGEDSSATGFTEVSSKICQLYALDKEVDSKIYLFAMQTFFNMFLKLLAYSFLAKMIDPAFEQREEVDKMESNNLFDGILNKSEQRVGNFFESHFLEWFTYTATDFELPIINGILNILNGFDLGTFVLKPESVQDILQEIYMSLIPKEMRHLMGEYFSPDWIVEHTLHVAGFSGDISSSLIDPCCGSGSFLTQALKLIIAKNKSLTIEQAEEITHHIVGFDINPISVVAAKTNYILVLFSALFSRGQVEDSHTTIDIPIFISDSVLSPVVYTETTKDVLKLDTSIGELSIPKFDDFKKATEFLAYLSDSIDENSNKDTRNKFIASCIAKKLIRQQDVPVSEKLYNTLALYHRSGQDSFWPKILKNSFAPSIIAKKFDYVVGNPPWIAWKSMSRQYRDGTLSVWKSYGIFEKNAYDKRTTHDDFAMAVTYVSIDKYLRNGGTLAFLLPASFLKSTKGGQGFRKFRITRHHQDIPFAVERVDDFSNSCLFTIPTDVIKIKKGTPMQYPMNNYYTYTEIGGKKALPNHSSWDSVKDRFIKEQYSAVPVDVNDLQSSWLTMRDLQFAEHVLMSEGEKPVYMARKGIEPAGAKGVYILKKPKKCYNGKLRIENDLSRQRRKDFLDKGVHIGEVEPDYIYPMLGGRNIRRWAVKSNEYMLVPHTAEYKYGLPESELIRTSPYLYDWFHFYHDELLASRIQNCKFFNPEKQPFYAVDNVGTYTFSRYKVLWKEQSHSFEAVVVGTYAESIPDASQNTFFPPDKPIVVDSKVLFLSLDDFYEAHYVCGILNAKCIREVIDSYAIGLNRGTDVLKYLNIPPYNPHNYLHVEIAVLSIDIHNLAKEDQPYLSLETVLSQKVRQLFL